MRIVTGLLLAWLIPVSVYAQQTIVGEQAPGMGALGVGIPGTAVHPGDAAGDSLYTSGLILYSQGYYTKAEKKFRQAFLLKPTAAAAGYLYSALMLEGKGLAASSFQKHNLLYTVNTPPYKRGFENVFLDAGPRISANANAGNMYYADIGARYCISSRLRFLQSLNYLQQDNNLGHYKQYESFSILSYYLGNGWTISPAIHYDYITFGSLSYAADSSKYSSSYVTKYGTYRYATAAGNVITYTAPGYSHYTHFALPLSKSAGAFTFEAEPSVHYFYSYYRTFYTDVSKGMTDSFLNNRYLGSKPYNYSDSGVVADTLTKAYIYQLGAAVTYRLPIRFEPVTLRFAAYYLFQDKITAMAYSFYSLVRVHEKLWIHLSWEKKGALPWALNYEGVYFNFNNPINSRAGISVQLFPAGRLSTLVTYQYESETRLQDGAKLAYHSCYLSIKYNLCKK